MPMNCHLKFRIIPPETACNDPPAASHKPEVLKLVWDEQGRGECCNGFNIIPTVIWWDFHPGLICQAQSSCADSPCSLPLLCADSEPFPEHQLQQNFAVLNGSNPWHGLPRVLQAPFTPSFQVLSFLYLVDKHLFPTLFITHPQQSAIVLSLGVEVFLVVFGFFYILRDLFFLFLSSGLGFHFLMQQRLWWESCADSQETWNHFRARLCRTSHGCLL